MIADSSGGPRSTSTVASAEYRRQLVDAINAAKEVLGDDDERLELSPIRNDISCSAPVEDPSQNSTLQKLKMELDNSKLASRKRMAGMQSKLAAAERRIASLQEQLAAAQTKEREMAAEAVAQTEKLIARGHEVEQVKTYHMTIMEELNELKRTDVGALRARDTDLSNKLEAATMELENLRAKIVDLQSLAYAGADERVAILRARNTELSNDVLSREKSLASKDQVIAESRARQQKLLHELSEVRDEADATKTAMAGLEAEIVALKATVASKDRALADLRVAVARSKDDLARYIEASEETNAEHRMQAHGMQNAVDEMHRLLAAAREDCVSRDRQIRDLQVSAEHAAFELSAAEEARTLAQSRAAKHRAALSKTLSRYYSLRQLRAFYFRWMVTSVRHRNRRLDRDLGSVRHSLKEQQELCDSLTRQRHRDQQTYAAAMADTASRHDEAVQDLEHQLTAVLAKVRELELTGTTNQELASRRDAASQHAIATLKAALDDASKKRDDDAIRFRTTLEDAESRFVAAQREADEKRIQLVHDATEKERALRSEIATARSETQKVEDTAAELRVQLDISKQTLSIVRQAEAELRQALHSTSQSESSEVQLESLRVRDEQIIQLRQELTQARATLDHERHSSTRLTVSTTSLRDEYEGTISMLQAELRALRDTPHSTYVAAESPSRSEQPRAVAVRSVVTQTAAIDAAQAGDGREDVLRTEVELLSQRIVDLEAARRSDASTILHLTGEIERSHLDELASFRLRESESRANVEDDTAVHNAIGAARSVTRIAIAARTQHAVHAVGTLCLKRLYHAYSYWSRFRMLRKLRAAAGASMEDVQTKVAKMRRVCEQLMAANQQLTSELADCRNQRRAADEQLTDVQTQLRVALSTPSRHHPAASSEQVAFGSQQELEALRERVAYLTDRHGETAAVMASAKEQIQRVTAELRRSTGKEVEALNEVESLTRRLAQESAVVDALKAEVMALLGKEATPPPVRRGHNDGQRESSESRRLAHERPGRDATFQPASDIL